MPMGYATLIGDMGTRCPAARSSACCSPARVQAAALLLLDEATSISTRRAKPGQFQHQVAELTRVVVAHRPKPLPPPIA
jgi:hypothetical protein